MDFEKGRAFLAEIQRARAAEEERHRLSAERIERYRQHEAYVAKILADVETLEPVRDQDPCPSPYVPADAASNAPPEPVGAKANPVTAKSRPDRIEDVMREAGGVLTTAEIAEKLRAEGDGGQFDRHEFWRIIDAALRKGALRGRFRKVGSAKAKWALARREPGLDLGVPKHNPHVHISGRDANGEHQGSQRMWQWIESVMGETGRSLSKSEIAEGLLRKGYLLRTSQHKFHLHIETAMKRHQDRFRKNDDGTWSLLNGETPDNDDVN